MTVALQALTPAALARAAGIPIGEARKVVSAIHRDRWEWAPTPTVRRASRAAAQAAGTEPRLGVVSIEKSALDPFLKLLLEAPDGARFETVRIPLERAGRFSVCVSSQVGCALGCTFCATGRLGLQRNLETWEIVEQVRAVRRTLGPGQRVHGVVFQGMGEPLANVDRVLEALAVLSDPCAQAIDARNVTVCTSGTPAGIARLAREAPKVRLGVSIGSALAPTRRRLMPISAMYDLDAVLAAAAAHARATGLAPLWAITLLDGVNDGPEHARALVARALAFAAQGGTRPRLTLVPYNSIGPGDPFKRSTRHEDFRAELAHGGVFAHCRYSGGADVAAACGQLVAGQ